jgi:hypothetical protein
VSTRLLSSSALSLWSVIGIDANEFTWSKIERLHQETTRAAQIFDLVIGIGGLAADDFDRLVGFGNSDDVEGRIAATAMPGLTNKSRVREIEQGCRWGFAQAAANVQRLSPAQASKTSNRYHSETRSRSHSAGNG